MIISESYREDGYADITVIDPIIGEYLMQALLLTSNHPIKKVRTAELKFMEHQLYFAQLQIEFDDGCCHDRIFDVLDGEMLRLRVEKRQEWIPRNLHSEQSPNAQPAHVHIDKAETIRLEASLEGANAWVRKERERVQALLCNVLGPEEKFRPAILPEVKMEEKKLPKRRIRLK